MRRRRVPLRNLHTTVYLFYDLDGDLLYVGITNHLIRRLAQHAADKPWWTAVASASFEHYRTRADAVARERTLIRRHRPVHNVAHARQRRAVQSRVWVRTYRRRLLRPVLTSRAFWVGLLVIVALWASGEGIGPLIQLVP